MSPIPLSDETQQKILEMTAAGAGFSEISQTLSVNQFALMAVLGNNGYSFTGDTIVKRGTTKTPAVDALKKPKCELTAEEIKERAARKKHKLAAEDLPAFIKVYTSKTDWRRYPGAPEVLITSDKHAYVQKRSRRHGEYFAPVPKRSWKGKEFWRYSKKGRKAIIPVNRAMYECGFWQKKPRMVENS